MASKTSSTNSSTPVQSDLPQFVKDRIPSIDLFDSYVPRVLPSGLTDVDTLVSYYFDTNPETGSVSHTSVRLEGPTGAGKTHLIEAVAAKLQIPLWTIPGKGDSNTRSLYGGVTEVLEADGTTRLEFGYGILPLWASFGGLLYLDEDNFVDPSITGALHPVLDYRKELLVDGHYVPQTSPDGSVRYVEEVLKVSPDGWVLGASNPGYIGTQQHNQAFRNRFQPLKITYDRAVESTFVPSSVLNLAAAIRAAKDSIWSPFGTNRLIAFHKDITRRGYDHAVYALLSYFEDEEAVVVENLLRDSYEHEICTQYGIIDSVEPTV